MLTTTTYRTTLTLPIVVKAGTSHSAAWAAVKAAAMNAPVHS